jgi:probable DNA metabolism protein
MSASCLVFGHGGDFAGFLCATGEFLNALGKGRDPAGLRVADPVRPVMLFEELRQVERDQERAARIWSRLGRRIGEAGQRALLEAFCSDFPGRHGAIARLIARLWVTGPDALDDLGDDDARLVEKAANRTRRQAHLITGLLRFAELADGSLFATIDPDCDVLALVADHFADRFPAFSWAIRDERRDAAVVHEPGSGWSIGSSLTVGGHGQGEASGDGSGDGQLPVSGVEEAVVAAWLRYFEAIAIGERANPRLQSAHMPKKYWKNLPERKSL